MIVMLSDLGWQDDRDMRRSTGSYATFVQGRLFDYVTNVPDPIAMSSGEAEYNTCTVVGMSSLHNHNFDCCL